MNRFFQAIIRMSAFLRKEIFSVLRQPRLLLTLVLGPFLILLIFGIGYNNQPRSLRTLFVVEKGSPLEAQVEQYASSLGPQLIYKGVVYDEEEAFRLLRQKQVDVVAVAPKDAYDTIRNDQQAVFILYHHEIDPFQVDYINYFGQIYIDEVNRRVLTAITQQGQSDASTVQDDIKAARQNAATMRQALEAGDEAAASRAGSDLSGNVDAVSLAVGASLGVLNGVEQTLGPSQSGSDSGSATEILNTLSSIQQRTNEVNSSTSGSTTAEDIQKATEIENDLAALDERLSEFTNIDANVLVKPFRSEARSIAETQPDPSHFYAPAVIALLLQHMAVTFAGLSIVSERTVGAMELFRVSPLSAGETLFGKYLSYLILSSLIAAALVLLMIYVLGVPMLGRWADLVLVLLVLQFTSLGYGFVISILSQTDSQAIQYTMIFLLTSVFFGGFLITLDMLIRPVRVLSWALPTTYGTVLLRDIFLRGSSVNLITLGGLAGIGVLLALIAWLLMNRLISSKR